VNATCVKKIHKNNSSSPEHNQMCGVVNKFPDWIFCACTERSYHTSR